MTNQPVASTSTARVEGYVYWWNQSRSSISTNGARYAVVKAIPLQGGHAQIARADDSGKFLFEGLSRDKWIFIPLHERGRAFGQSVAVRTKDIQADTTLDLSLLELGVVDNELGVKHFRTLMAVLLVAFLIYLALHLIWPAQVRSASLGLDALVAQVAEQVGSSSALSTNADLSANLAELRRIATALGENTQIGLTDADTAELDSLLTRIEAAVAQDSATAARLAVLRLQYLLRFLGTTGYYWTGEPGRYIEVLFWALAGVVISQLVDTSTYLRRGTYLRDAQMQRYTLLVAAPLVTLVLVLLLSLAALEITLDSGGQIRLDLGDPRILAAVAFIFGLSFWRSWDNLQGFSQRFLGGDSPST
jgi:hypothetical protein